MIDKDKKVADLSVAELELMMGNAQTKIIERVCQNMFDVRGMKNSEETMKRMYFLDGLISSGSQFKSGFLSHIGSSVASVG